MIPAKGAFTPPTSAEEHTMAFRFADIAFTPAVQALQDRNGSRRQYARMQARSSGTDQLGTDELEFLSRADSFYLATVSETGWPYVQHRGGPPGFLTALDARTLVFADLRGNRQLVTVGNLATNARVALILVDYPNRARLKLLAHAELVAAASDPTLAARLAPGGETRSVERLVRLHVVGFDWNCPQNITPRYTAAEVEAYVASLGHGGG
jgi:predicted pyridoxine 5'-phosphate oxidase superfamily flavin-nucleotide-binding protein